MILAVDSEHESVEPTWWITPQHRANLLG